MTKIIIIGAGPAGTAASLKAAEAGWETVLVEKDKLGGQHKIPRLSNERDYLEQLLGMQIEIPKKK